MGKGSKQRPRVIDNDTFESNWDRIFDKKPKPERANWWNEADVDEDAELNSEFAHPAYTRYPHLKERNYKDKQQDLTELNGDGNRDRGRYGEDLTVE